MQKPFTFDWRWIAIAMTRLLFLGANARGESPNRTQGPLNKDIKIIISLLNLIHP